MLSSMNEAIIVSLGIPPFKGLSPMRQAFYIIKIPRTNDLSAILLTFPAATFDKLTSGTAGHARAIALALLSKQVPHSTGSRTLPHSLLTP
jgi:hypothetical protein